jgi:hypothetical protein
VISPRVKTEHALMEDWADSTAPGAQAQAVVTAERRTAFLHIDASDEQ